MGGIGHAQAIKGEMLLVYYLMLGDEDRQEELHKLQLLLNPQFFLDSIFEYKVCAACISCTSG